MGIARYYGENSIAQENQFPAQKVISCTEMAKLFAHCRVDTGHKCNIPKTLCSCFGSRIFKDSQSSTGLMVKGGCGLAVPSGMNRSGQEKGRGIFGSSTLVFLEEQRGFEERNFRSGVEYLLLGCLLGAATGCSARGSEGREALPLAKCSGSEGLFRTDTMGWVFRVKTLPKNHAQ